MKIMQRIMLCRSFFVLALLFTIYGCQTVSNTITSESSVSNLQSDSSQVDTENTGRRTPQTSPAEKETTTTEKLADKVTGKSDEIEKKSLAELEKNMINRWAPLLGHGGVPQSSSVEEEATTAEMSVDKVTGRSDEIGKGSFVELEESVIGKWMNLKETEAIEFLDDGTMLIGTEENSHPKVRGYYKFVDNDRLKVHFGKGFYNKLLPPMSFKIAVSENEITLTDEPDGAATRYKRIK